MNTISKEDIQKMSVMVEAATPGPWRAGSSYKHLEETQICEGLFIIAPTDFVSDSDDWNNAEFIAAARDFIPRALAALTAAPAAVETGEGVVLTKEKLVALLNEHVGHAWWCNREWSAWSVGTMTQDDFSELHNSDAPEELADAILSTLSSRPAAVAPGEAELPRQALIAGIPRLPQQTRKEFLVRLADGSHRKLWWLEDYTLDSHGDESTVGGWHTCKAEQGYSLFFREWKGKEVTHYLSEVPTPPQPDTAASPAPQMEGGQS